jgi:hypothetical protein
VRLIESEVEVKYEGGKSHRLKVLPTRVFPACESGHSDHSMSVEHSSAAAQLFLYSK